jgi:hypothetical protein
MYVSSELQLRLVGTLRYERGIISKHCDLSRLSAGSCCTSGKNSCKLRLGFGAKKENS